MSKDIFCLFPYGKSRKIHQLRNPVEAWIFYPKAKKNLITGKKTFCDGAKEISENLDLLEDKKYIYIIHLNYEFGHNQYEDQKDFLDDETCLGVFLKFKKSDMSLLGYKQPKKGLSFSSENKPSYRNYQRDFNQGLKELMAGNCYQYNLTYQFKYKVNDLSKENLVGSYLGTDAKKLGRFSMLTYIGCLKKAFWSNTPESLFQLKRDKNQTVIQTLPIKGTVDIKKAGGKKKAWEILKKSQKDQAELYMITDLLRNDLNKIEKPVCDVIKKKVPLMAPGIMHQMSLIQISLSRKVKLSRVVQSLFPGGSITGAPKKRVMEILRRVESRDRGLYCGSTLFVDHDRVDCSINIRTAEIDFNRSELTYSAGGGITVLSNARSEYEEMLLKVKSFTDILGN